MKAFALMMDAEGFAFYRLDENGDQTSATHWWRIQPGLSMLPQAIFYHIFRKVRSATSRKAGDVKGIVKALVLAGEECDCCPDVDSSPLGVVWFKGDQPLISFAISQRADAAPAVALLRFRVDIQGFIHPEVSGVE